MILLEQKLIAETPNSTASILKHGDKFLGFIIEDGHREVKEYGKTRIPGGCYEIVPLSQGEFYEKYKLKYGHTWVPMLKNVPGFTSILIHILNFVTETKGCLGPNTNLGFDSRNNVFTGSGSADAYKKLWTYLDLFVDDEPIFINIRR